ncbi:hypothetical protein MMC21_004971 [Puttea exsequens]|nr:hypothetical protein [Puttea exsequens]
MAPKRGGGGSIGGSSGGGSSSGSSSTYYNPNPWFEKTRLYGSHFTEPAIVANIVFTGIYLVMLISVLVWRISYTKRSEPARSVLGWKYGFAIWFVLVCVTTLASCADVYTRTLLIVPPLRSFAFYFIETILEEARITVVPVYYIIAIILNSTSYIADIFLFITIFCLLYHILSPPTNSPKTSSKRNILKLHYAFGFVLFALFVSMFGLRIRDEVGIVEGKYQATYAYLTGGAIPVQNQLDVAFGALGFVLSVEILLASIYILLKASKHDIPTKIGIILIALVALPLFIRRIFILAFSAAFELSATKYQTDGQNLALNIVTGICTVLSYAGVVFAIIHLDKARQGFWTDQSAAAGAVPPLPGYVDGRYNAVGVPPPQQYGGYPNQGYAPQMAQQQGYPPGTYGQQQGYAQQPLSPGGHPHQPVSPVNFPQQPVAPQGTYPQGGYAAPNGAQAVQHQHQQQQPTELKAHDSY